MSVVEDTTKGEEDISVMASFECESSSRADSVPRHDDTESHGTERDNVESTSSSL